jgi:hypothetical protein
MRTFAIIFIGFSVAGLSQAQDATPKTNIAFKFITGTENGSRAILEKRKAALLERRGGKLQSHDWWLWGLTPLDYDRDGDPDFLVTIHGPHHGVVLESQFKQTGKLTFADITRELGVDNILPAATGRRTHVWDFDGDGWLDVVGIGSPHLLNQKGKRFLPLAKAGFLSFSPQAIVDLNGDSHPDFYNNAGQNGIWNPAKQTFELKPFTHPVEAKLPANLQKFWQDAKAKPANRFLRSKYFTDHDLDGDGSAEIIMTGYASYGGDVFARYLRQDKDGLHDATGEIGLPTEGAPILVRDLDGDGYLDVLIAAAPPAGFYRNDGKGKFRLQAGRLTELLKSRDPYLHRAEAVDFNQDGLLDLVVTKPRSGQTVIYANLGDGIFELIHQLKGWDSDPVATCDLNDDGLVDLAIGGPGDQVSLLVNTTEHPGNGSRLYMRMAAPNHHAVGAKLELYRAGGLKEGARPIRIEAAPHDATPIHLGLGKDRTCDLRATFPGHEPRDWPNVELAERSTLTPQGIAPAQDDKRN